MLKMNAVEPAIREAAGMTVAAHVLAVDDDPSVRQMIVDYLGDNDIRVTALASGRQIAGVMARDTIDLLILHHAHRAERRGRPRHGPRARRRRLSDQAVFSARAPRAHPRAPAQEPRAAERRRWPAKNPRVPLRRVGVERAPPTPHVAEAPDRPAHQRGVQPDRKSTRLNSSHTVSSYAV